MKKVVTFLAITSFALISGCAGKMEFSQPTAPRNYETSKTVTRSLSE